MREPASRAPHASNERVRRAAELGLGEGDFRGHELAYDGRHAIVYDDEAGARALAEELGTAAGFKTSPMRHGPGSFSLVPLPGR